VQFTINPGWRDNVYAGTDALFLTRLGPAIWTDARALCPVFGGQNSTATAVSLAAAGDDYEPGSLLDSLEFHLAGHSLIVSATGSEDRGYAAYVECGHEVVAWGNRMGYSKGPSPFLRPALYQLRAAA
jgi:hypothetical protein